MSKIADDILDILGECRTEGNTLYLPDRQLERSTYQAVNKVLESIGGKWDRKAKGHVFADGDPAELLDNVILAGEITDLKKQYQFFSTPRPIAEKMCELAELDSTCIVLEPSCGKGDLADVIYEAGVKELVGLELNREMEKHLTGKPYATLTGIDFLEFVKDPGIKTPWTRIVMNPPFSRQQDIDHILTAYGILRPGGILVSVVSESPFFRSNKKSVDFRAFLDEHEAVIVPLEEGAFKESGTMVRTRLVKIVKSGTSEEGPQDEPEKPATEPPQEPEKPTPPAKRRISMPNEKKKPVSELEELAQNAEKLEQEAKQEPDTAAYTHHFGKPFTWEDRTYEELTFDWGSLTGADHLEIENELMAMGKTLVTPAFSGDFLAGMAVRACTSKLNVQTLKKMPIRDFQAITKRARSFLLRAE